MAVQGVLCCTVCGGHGFVAVEYVTKEAIRAPALKCLLCNAIHLDEAVARSSEERESVRLAKAERAAVTDSGSCEAANDTEGPAPTAEPA
jgi:hypothetical protein